MKVLILVDMQNDFITGSLGTEEAQAIVPNVVKKLKAYYNDDNYAVIFTKDTHHSDYLSSEEGKHLPIEHCIEDTDGCLFEPSISDMLDDESFFTDENKQWVVSKNTFGAKNLFGVLDYINNHLESSNKIDSIELVGLCTDICVIANAIICKTALPDVPIIVDASCCAGSTPEAHVKALELMRDSLQIHVINWEN